MYSSTALLKALMFDIVNVADYKRRDQPDNTPILTLA